MARHRDGVLRGEGGVQQGGAGGQVDEHDLPPISDWVSLALYFHYY